HQHHDSFGQFLTGDMSQGGDPLGGVGHRVGNHQILDVVLIQECAELGERHRNLQAEPLAGKLLRPSKVLHVSALTLLSAPGSGKVHKNLAGHGYAVSRKAAIKKSREKLAAASRRKSDLRLLLWSPENGMRLV